MPEITINVKCSNDQKYSVTIDTSKTVLEFKQAIAEKCDTTADRQRLIYSGRVLKDNDTLETYKIAEGHTVHMVKSSAPSGSSQAQAQASQQTQSATTGNTQTPQQPTGISPNPFAQFGAMGGFNQGTNPYGGMQNPLDLLQNPAIMQYMQQMLQDPQFVESMIHMNPQFSSMAPQIRQMMQDPDFQAMMSNPETYRNLAALQPLMGNLGPLTGGAIPGFPGYNAPATTGTNPTTNSTTNPTTNTTAGNTTGTTTTGSTPTSNTTPSTTTPSINNNPFLPYFNPTAAGAAGTGTMPLFDPLLWGALGGVPPTTTPTTASASATSQTPQTPQVPPEERFQSQLQQLNDMGFVDAQKNIRALQICQGNVNFAIERLLDPSF
ncbi:10605_t:CDS:2 [Dentiscutata heterogama]|uniref:10605_t:CDS:1 n=1 Tax=Dentiscutata heterogama TaxID=1316150 RepID=A0ACA9NX66_9GLOM|nr:10605_t:CDS:2 [Dentiscutata heterogama]